MSDSLCHAAASLMRYFYFFSFLLYFVLFGNGARAKVRCKSCGNEWCQDANCKRHKEYIKRLKKSKACKTYLHTKSTENTKHLIRLEGNY